MDTPLVTVAVTTQKRTRKGRLTGEPETTHHAVRLDSDHALCGRSAAGTTALAILAWETHPIVVGRDEDGEDIIGPERWPRHWPSTDRRPVCGRCIASAELSWRRIDKQPNVRLLDSAELLTALAREATVMVADAKEELHSLGYPTSGPGSGGYADHTGTFVARAYDLASWVEDERDLIAGVIGAVRALDKHHSPKRRKAIQPVGKTNRGTCGSAQKAMTEADREGWTIDLQCGALGVYSDGLCDRCHKRRVRAQRAA